MRQLTKEMEMKKIKMILKDGDVVIQPLADVAPKHVVRVMDLIKSGFYDGLTFHRVIDGFMAQTGCPAGTGTGGTGVKIPAEFSHESFTRGAVGMARAFDKNSADSQFFICFDDCDYLDGNYTLWGRVVSGMEFIDNIKRGNIKDNGLVVQPDKIIRMELID